MDMANLPKPEEMAGAIIRVYLHHFQLRPGEALSIQNIRAGAKVRGADWGEIEMGMKFALKQGWLEARREDERAYWLTDSGFKAYGGLIPTPQQTARTILEIFVTDCNCKAGDVLGFPRIRTGCTRHRVESRDIPDGLKYAIKQCWLAQHEATDSAYVLTDIGFETGSSQ